MSYSTTQIDRIIPAPINSAKGPSDVILCKACVSSNSKHIESLNTLFYPSAEKIVIHPHIVMDKQEDVLLVVRVDGGIVNDG